MSIQDKFENVRSLYRQLHNLLILEEQLTFALGETYMDTALVQLIAAMDEATNKIAARIQKLIDSQGNLTEEAKTALNVEVAKLQALGADPTAPIPADV